jgi:hypothetical protein
VRLTPASDIERRKTVWLWQDRIPAGEITLMPGREGIGKSLALAWLSARITRGELPGVHFGTPKSVIYAATEDSWAHTIGPRLVAAGADLDRVFRADVLSNEAITSLTLPLDITELFSEAERRDVALLACDPILSLLSSQIDANKEQQLRRALEPLKAAADLTGCSVVGLAHFNKSGGTDPLSLIIGARAWPGVCRAVLAMARDPADEEGGCVMTLDKCNVGPMWPEIPSLRYFVRATEVDTIDGPASVGLLAFTGETPRGVSQILAETSADPFERAEHDEAAAWLVEYLTGKGGRAPAADAVKAARADGISERTLKRARTRAGITSHREGYPSRATWKLSENPSSDSCATSRATFLTPGTTGTTGTTGPTGQTPAQRDEPDTDELFEAAEDVLAVAASGRLPDVVAGAVASLSSAFEAASGAGPHDQLVNAAVLVVQAAAESGTELPELARLSAAAMA